MRRKELWLGGVLPCRRTRLQMSVIRTKMRRYSRKIRGRVRSRNMSRLLRFHRSRIQ
jgi:hypothetical protein